jgi:hypothetical protein
MSKKRKNKSPSSRNKHLVTMASASNIIISTVVDPAMFFRTSLNLSNHNNNNNNSDTNSEQNYLDSSLRLARKRTPIKSSPVTKLNFNMKPKRVSNKLINDLHDVEYELEHLIL